MLRFFSRRLLAAIPVILGVVTLVFLLIHFVPGDPVDMILGENADVSEKLALRESLGLNQSLWRQYLHFWKSLVAGGWGLSFAFKRPVLDLILERFPATAWLALWSLLVALVIALPLGIASAYRKNSWLDYFSTGFSLLGMSLPIFVVGPFGILIFSIALGLLPVSGYDGPLNFVLPSFCLGFSMSGILCRMLRTTMLELLQEDFMRCARSKGLSEWKVLWVHALRNALLPVITLLGNMLGGLLAGAVLTETLFDWPGIGRLFYSAFQSRDYPLIQGIVLWIALFYVLINMGVDLLYSWIDPRITFEAAEP